ncbi:sensor histidine kinase [Paenibacillus thalictri]|uniref:Sensor histidine kinase n=1 Tax=Paenibacillus thalictri TaxID=2527873 RepID=A0A4Q9DQS3_9BACL|nr:sensor histidine kinase [Paenibacillus thalictri]TBL78959.1 sensor histidine kinase [Paenibacillus thalictri]
MKTIQGKMFVAFGLTILLAIIVIAYSSYYSSAKVIERNATSYISDRIQGANDNLQSMVEEADNVAKSIVIRDLIHQSLVSHTEAPTLEWFQEKKAVEEFLGSMAAFKNYVRQITVIGQGDVVFYTGYRAGNSEFVASLWRDPQIRENRRHLLFDPSGSGRIMLVRPVLSSGDLIGLCIVDFDPNLIRQVYEIEPLSETVVSVIDESGSIMYDSRTERIGSRLEDRQLLTLLAGVDPGKWKSSKVSMDNRPYLAVLSRSAYTGWATVTMVPLSVLLSEVKGIGSQILTMTVIVLAAVLLVSIFLSKQITKNIKRLHSAMRLVREGHMNARPRIKIDDEIGQLSDMFVSMMDHLQELLHKVKTQERERREAEYRALQAQIKPHFLYNTLNTIKYLARIQHAPNIEEISGSLIELMRFAIDPQREMIAVREELEQVDRYVRIQRYKFLDRITVNVKAEEEVLDCLIPKLIVQPIVENAMNHGLGTTDREGTVSIRIYSDGPLQLKLSVTDDGTGMDSATLERINSCDHDKSIDLSRTGGIGLSNIRERLQLAYGEPYGLSIYSQPGVFTTVEMTIPQVRRRNGIATQGYIRG